MTRLLYLEFFKTRRRHVGLCAVAAAAVQILWALFALSRMEEAELMNGWFYFLYQTPMICAIVMPVTCAMIASRLADTEHRGRMFKLLETALPAGRLFDAKFLCGAAYVAATVGLQLGSIAVAGVWKDFGGSFPTAHFFWCAASMLAVGLVLLLIQQTISLLFENQAVPLLIGVFGAFCGLFSLFFPRLIQRFVLWGYYGVLSSVAMDWDQTTRATSFYAVPFDWTGLATLAVVFVLLYLIGRRLFVRKEA